MIRAIRPSAMAQDDASLVTGWNVSPNLAYTLQLNPGQYSCGVLLYSDDQTALVASGAGFVGTDQPVILHPYSGQALGMVDADLGWHLLLTTEGTESPRTIRIGPAVDLPDEIHPVYADDDLALVRATAGVDDHAHYIDDVSVTCPRGFGAWIGDVASVPVDGVAVDGQAESVTWTGTPSGASDQVVIRRHVAIAPEPFMEIIPPTVADDAGTATHLVGTSGNVLTNDESGLVITAVNGLSSNVGVSTDGSNGGSFTINTDGSWTFSPDGDFALLSGSETANTSITYYASDGTSEASATLTVAVSYANAAPVAVDDTGTTDAATTTSGNVLTNDSDADLDSLTVSKVAGVAGNVGVAMTGSAGGLFTIGADGAWTFDPDGDFGSLTGEQTATTSVTYHVSDGVAEDEGTLTVTVSAATALWTPAGITTALWIDAADASTITLNGQKVTQWADKSGNGRHVTQGTDSLRPTLGTNRIVFGGSHWLKNSTAQLPLSAFACAVVFKEAAAVANAGVLSVKGSSYDYSSTNGFVFSPSNKTNTRLVCTGSTSSNFELKDTASPTGPCPLAVYVVDKAASTGSLYRDGNHLATDASFTAFTSMSLGGIVLGARQLPSTPTAPYLNGEIMEIVYALAADRQKLEGYLAHKWDALLGVTTLVAALPSDHPYKSAAPTV